MQFNNEFSSSNDPCIEGGESIMLDAYPVVKEMREKYPRQFDTLTKVPVTFYRVHHSHDNNPCDMKFARPHIVLDKEGQVGEDPLFNCHHYCYIRSQP